MARVKTVDTDAGKVSGTVHIGESESTTGARVPVDYEGSIITARAFRKACAGMGEDDITRHYAGYVAGIVLDVQQAAKAASGKLAAGVKKSAEEVAAARKAGAEKAAAGRKARETLAIGLASGSITKAQAVELAARVGLELNPAVLATLQD